MERINNHEEGSLDPKEQNKQRGNMAETIVVVQAKAKKALLGVATAAAAIGVTVGSIAGFNVGKKVAETEYNREFITEEEYEEQLSFFLDHQENSTVTFNEDGSATVTYEQTPLGETRKYTLEDLDRDSKFEHGVVIEGKGGGDFATFDNENGLDIISANDELDVNLNQIKFSNPNSN